MRLGRLAAGGLVTGALAGFVVALVRPRRRGTVVDLPTADGAPVAPAGIELPQEPATAAAPHEGQGPR